MEANDGAGNEVVAILRLGFGWRAELNVARPGGNELSAANPLDVAAGSALVSSISKDDGGQRAPIDTMAILTVLASAPPANSFRPAYSAADKTIRYNTSMLRRDLLQSLAPPSGLSSSDLPTAATVAAWLQRPWIDHVVGFEGESLHPTGNMPNYGRDLASQLAAASLMLHFSSLTAEEKEPILIHLVQFGIDSWTLKQHPTNGNRIWTADGGHCLGRVWPIIFAGLMLDDDALEQVAARSGAYAYTSSYHEAALPPDYAHFGELDQSFYVTSRDVARTLNAGKTPYTEQDLGLPDYGITHTTEPEADDSSTISSYRGVNSPVWQGLALAAHIMGAQPLLNSRPYFDYNDRYVVLQNQHPGDSGYPVVPLFRQTWELYRANYGCTYLSLDTTHHTRSYRCGADELNCYGLTSYPAGNTRAQTYNPCGI